MKKTIGLIALLFISNAAIAEEISTTKAEAMPAETNLLESDAAVETAATETIKKEQAGFSRGSVVRSAFTREIDEREPTENLQNLSNDNTQVKFFTELRDMSGQTAIHRWEYDGKVIAEVKFNVKGPRWRVWSSKSFTPKWTGDWKVSVVNGAGDIISEKNLSYDLAKAETAPAEMKSESATTAPAESNTEATPADTMQ